MHAMDRAQTSGARQRRGSSAVAPLHRLTPRADPHVAAAEATAAQSRARRSARRVPKAEPWAAQANVEILHAAWRSSFVIESVNQRIIGSLKCRSRRSRLQ